MHRLDVALALLVVAAAVLTGVAVAQDDDWTGERTYRFTAADLPLASQGPTAASGNPARLEWPAPANATAVHLEVAIEMTGQAVQGGNAVVRVSGTAPDGSPLPVQTRTMPVGQGAASASLSFQYNASWAETPRSVRDTQAPPAQPSAQPLVVLVAVERPGDVPVAMYAFMVSATGTVRAYAA